MSPVFSGKWAPLAEAPLNEAEAVVGSFKPPEGVCPDQSFNGAGLLAAITAPAG